MNNDTWYSFCDWSVTNVTGKLVWVRYCFFSVQEQACLFLNLKVSDNLLLELPAVFYGGFVFNETLYIRLTYISIISCKVMQCIKQRRIMSKQVSSNFCQNFLLAKWINSTLRCSFHFFQFNVSDVFWDNVLHWPARFILCLIYVYNMDTEQYW